jgi:predicted dehydrogenase
MQAGKDVLLEKPMGLSRAECAVINRVAERTGRILQIGMANRFSAVAQAARPIVSTGELGHIYHAKALLYRRRGVPGLGGWFTTKEISGGGALIDNGVHIIDLALWLMGFPPVTRVSGKVYSFFGKRMKDYVYETMWAGPPNLEGVCDVEDSAHALVHFVGGATLDLHVAWAINVPIKLESSLMGFFGDRGGLTFELFGDHLDLATEQNGRNVDRRIDVSKVDQFTHQMRAFAQSIQTREAPVATGQQGEFVQSILDAIYESSLTDREVVFSA